jgi:seryl-tRNA synthetase
MLEIKFVIQNLLIVQKALSDRGKTADLEVLSQCDARRKTVLLELEDLRCKRNTVSDQIAIMKKAGDNASSLHLEQLVAEMRDVSLRVKFLEKSFAEVEEKLQCIILEIPNIPHITVPVGKTVRTTRYIKPVVFHEFLISNPCRTGHWANSFEFLILNGPRELPAPDFHCISEQGPGWKGH